MNMVPTQRMCVNRHVGSGICEPCDKTYTILMYYNNYILAGIWSYVRQIVKDYTVTNNDIHVTTGPIYDYNHDGRADVEIYNNTKYVQKVIFSMKMPF